MQFQIVQAVLIDSDKYGEPWVFKKLIGVIFYYLLFFNHFLWFSIDFLSFSYLGGWFSFGFLSFSFSGCWFYIDFLSFSYLGSLGYLKSLSWTLFKLFKLF